MRDRIDFGRFRTGLQGSLPASQEIEYAQFKEVAETLAAGYERLLSRGLDGRVVAHAMLFATVNLYELFDMSSELPTYFRQIADQIEKDAATQAWKGRA